MIKKLNTIVSKNLENEESCILANFYPLDKDLLITISEENGGDLDIVLIKEQISELKLLLNNAIEINKKNYNWYKLNFIKSKNGDDKNSNLFIYLHSNYIVLGISKFEFLNIEKYNGTKILLNDNQINEFIKILSIAESEC